MRDNCAASTHADRPGAGAPHNTEGRLRDNRAAPSAQTDREPESRLDAVFRAGRPILACYLPIGDYAVPYADAQLYVDEGVDVLEVGVPTFDATLDGPIIAGSMRRARRNGMTKERAAVQLAACRSLPGNPAAVWMGYPAVANESGFAEALAASQADGVLIAGVAPGTYPVPAGTHEIQFVPHQPSDNQIAAAVNASGYVMVAADHGVSGPRERLPLKRNTELLARMRAFGVTAPILLGFGIVGGASARRALDCGADGVIVGSAVLAAAMRSRDAVRRILAELREALDG